MWWTKKVTTVTYTSSVGGDFTKTKKVIDADDKETAKLFKEAEKDIADIERHSNKIWKSMDRMFARIDKFFK